MPHPHLSSDLCCLLHDGHVNGLFSSANVINGECLHPWTKCITLPHMLLSSSSSNICVFEKPEGWKFLASKTGYRSVDLCLSGSLDLVAAQCPLQLEDCSSGCQAAQTLWYMRLYWCCRVSAAALRILASFLMGCRHPAVPMEVGQCHLHIWQFADSSEEQGMLESRGWESREMTAPF